MQVGVVLAILGINMLLALISRSLTLFEKHHTRSNEARSLAHRLFLAQVRWSDADCLADCLLWHGVLRCQSRVRQAGSAAAAAGAMLGRVPHDVLFWPRRAVTGGYGSHMLLMSF